MRLKEGHNISRSSKTKRLEGRLDADNDNPASAELLLRNFLALFLQSFLENNAKESESHAEIDSVIEFVIVVRRIIINC